MLSVIYDLGAIISLVASLGCIHAAYMHLELLLVTITGEHLNNLLITSYEPPLDIGFLAFVFNTLRFNSIEITKTIIDGAIKTAGSNILQYAPAFSEQIIIECTPNANIVGSNIFNHLASMSATYISGNDISVCIIETTKIKLQSKLALITVHATVQFKIISNLIYYSTKLGYASLGYVSYRIYFLFAKIKNIHITTDTSK